MKQNEEEKGAENVTVKEDSQPGKEDQVQSADADKKETTKPEESTDEKDEKSAVNAADQPGADMPK